MIVQNFNDCIKGDSFGAKTVNIDIDDIICINDIM